MPLLKWEESYSVGNSEMDAEHIKLIGILNLLFDGMKEGKGKDVLGQVFTDLIEYTKVHFADEEKLMSKYNFPELFTHSAQHRDLENQVMDLYSRFKSGEAFISIDVMNFLKDWLTNHIRQSDKKYGVFFRSMGVY